MQNFKQEIARRAHGLVRLALVVAVVLAALPATGRAGETDAASQIRSFYASLLDTMEHGPALGEKGRYDKLAPVIAQTFDIPYMARMSVGQYWSSLSPAQQQAVTAAFDRYVVATWADRFDAYSGEKLEVDGTRTGAYGSLVETKIVKPDGDAVTIDYLMRQTGGRWAIADVYLTGTISELATRRSEFTSILQRKGIDELIATLNRKADLLVASNQS